jgi:TRAP-type C4-dicarboxylate transport system substrate-binding protein
MNEAFFQSLPEPAREDVLACAKEALSYQSDVARELEREALEALKAENVVVTYPDPAPFVPLVRPHVWESVTARLPEGGCFRLQVLLRG